MINSETLASFDVELVALDARVFSLSVRCAQQPLVSSRLTLTSTVAQQPRLVQQAARRELIRLLGEVGAALPFVVSQQTKDL